MKFFNDRKGWGFIEPESGGDDIFVHDSAIVGDGYRTLADGDIVQFEVFMGEKGARARKVFKRQREFLNLGE